MKNIVKKIDINLLLAVACIYYLVSDLAKGCWVWAILDFVVLIANVLMTRPVVRWIKNHDEGIGGA